MKHFAVLAATAGLLFALAIGLTQAQLGGGIVEPGPAPETDPTLTAGDEVTIGDGTSPIDLIFYSQFTDGKIRFNGVSQVYSFVNAAEFQPGCQVNVGGNEVKNIGYLQLDTNANHLSGTASHDDIYSQGGHIYRRLDAGDTNRLVVADKDGYIVSPIWWEFSVAHTPTIGQGTWVNAANASAPYGRLFQNTTTHADGDNCSFDFSCPAGTYTLSIVTLTSSSRGILDIDIDGAEVATTNLYTVALNWRHVADFEDIAISAGKHTMRYRVDGKDGSSSDHLLGLFSTSLIRTGD